MSPDATERELMAEAERAGLLSVLVHADAMRLPCPHALRKRGRTQCLRCLIAGPAQTVPEQLAFPGRANANPT